MRAVIAALLLIPALSVEAGDPFNGHTIYGKHCLSCHGNDGSGEIVGIPNLRKGEGLHKPDFQLVETLKMGVGAMPAYRGLLDDNELTDVITYIRTLQ